MSGTIKTLVIFPAKRGDQIREALEEADIETQRLDGFNGQLTKMVQETIIEAGGAIKVLVCNPRQREALIKGFRPGKWNESFAPPAIVSLRDNVRTETAVRNVNKRLSECAPERAATPVDTTDGRFDVV